MNLMTFSLYTVLVSSVIVGSILVYLYGLERQKHTGLWALGMLAYGATFLADALAHSVAPLSQMGIVVVSVLSGLLFVEGARHVRGDHGVSRGWLLAALVALIAAFALPGGLILEYIMPASAYLGAGFLYSMWLLFWLKGQTGSARLMAAVSLASLGLLAFLHPLMEHFFGADGLRGDYLWASVFIVSFGIGVLFMHVRESAARLAEQGTEVARQAALLDQVSDGILGLDMALNVTVWSSVCERMYGRSAEDTIGRPIAMVLPGEFVTAKPDVVFGRLASQGRVSWMMKHRNASGDEQFSEISGSQVTDDKGQVTGYVAVVRDVTERFKSQIEIHEGRERYRTLFESSPIPLWEEDFSAVKVYLDKLKATGVVDIARHFIENRSALLECIGLVRILDVNEATLKLYRADTKQVFREGLDPYVHEDSVSAFAEEFAALAAGATTFTSQVRSWTADGQELIVRFTLAVPPGYEETLELVLISDMDLTSYVGVQRELETYQDGLEELVERRTEQLREANTRMQEAIAAKDRLLANVSHEMRTPLNSIIGFTGVVAQGLAGDVTDEAKRQLTMANRSGKQLLALVNDLLDLSRLEHGSVQIEAAPVDIEALLHSTCEIIQPFAKDKGLLADCDVASLPMVRTDADRVRQVLLNLLSNAVKYTDEGSVMVSGHVADDAVLLCVTDTGRGIAAGDTEHVFEAFHQLAPTREAKHTGAGLGLAISREIAHLLGGELSVESRLGHGSVFTLSLPLDASGDSASHSG